jgi:hypothetical protein
MSETSNEAAKYAFELFNRAVQINDVWVATGYSNNVKIRIESKERDADFYYAILERVCSPATPPVTRKQAESKKGIRIHLPFQVLCAYYENRKVKIYTKAGSFDDFVIGKVKSINVDGIVLKFILSVKNGSIEYEKEVQTTLISEIEIL